MNKFLLILFISCSFFSSAQTKHLVYFRDKGLSEEKTFLKGSIEYNSAVELLSEKCIARRLKSLPEDSLITYEDLPLNENYISRVESLGIKIINRLKWFNAVSAYLTNEQINELSNFDFIKNVEPVKVLIFKPYKIEMVNSLLSINKKFSIFDYGPSYSQLQLSNIPIVHSRGITGQGVLVGLLDTGFDWQTHESLQNSNVVAEYDFVSGDSITSNQPEDRIDQHNHGTLVYSIIGGFKDSSLIGAAFGSDFILAKTEDVRSETHIEEDNYAAALEWMENYGVDITSSSLGYNIFDPETYSYSYEDMNGRTTIVTRACEVAFGKGVTTITAAGNEGLTNWRHIIAPADGFNTLAIGAVDENNYVAGFSSLGPTIDGRIKPELLTRGVTDYGATAGTFDNYSTASGTSVATPIASGIAALLLSAHPHLRNNQIRNIFFETSDNSSNPDNYRGYGLMSALKAIEFPNLDSANEVYTIHKIIIDPADVVSQSVTIHYSINGNTFDEIQMQFDNNLTYTFSLPKLFNNDLISFYFTYRNSINLNFRKPETGEYKFYYGQLNVSFILEPELNELFLSVSDPYPNPFLTYQNEIAGIVIFSGGGDKVKFMITDAAGQMIKQENFITINGRNYLYWNAKTANGTPVASGVYFFLFDISEKKFGRKIVLLR